MRSDCSGAIDPSITSSIKSAMFISHNINFIFGSDEGQEGAIKGSKIIHKGEKS